MSERMGKEELKDWLSCVFESYRTHPGLTVEKDDMKQAYNQLVEIVEEHFKDDTGWRTYLTEMFDTIKRQEKLRDEQAEQITKLLIQQNAKPKVTKDELWDKFCTYSMELDGKQPSDYYCGATVILEWLLGELGLDE